jgi:hypothetical protein
MAPTARCTSRDLPDGVFQLYRVKGDSVKADFKGEKLTNYKDGLAGFSMWDDGSKILLLHAFGGNENTQVSLLDTASGTITEVLANREGAARGESLARRRQRLRVHGQRREPERLLHLPPRLRDRWRQGQDDQAAGQGGLVVVGRHDQGRHASDREPVSVGVGLDDAGVGDGREHAHGLDERCRRAGGRCRWRRWGTCPTSSRWCT